LGQNLEIAGEAGGDPDRQTVVGPELLRRRL
jgi:hypothetical protein